MLIRIKNAGNAGHDRAYIPFSQMKFEVAKALQKEGYIKDAAPKGKKVQKTIEIEIAYSERQKPRIQGTCAPFKAVATSLLQRCEYQTGAQRLRYFDAFYPQRNSFGRRC